MEERAMKSDRKKRILAAILCMVMVLSGNISALAEGEVYADPDAVTQMETPEAVSETQPESAPQEPAAEEPPVSTEPAAPEAPAEEAPVFSEETELTKELRDASGKLVQKVTAKLPKGAFEAETSQIEMEVTYVDSSMENYIKGMMEKKLPTDNTLGDYFLYNIQFKVNGEAKESLEPITITFEKSNLEIKDTKKANVFFFDPANPEVSGDKDELVEITQRSELLESLQAAGQSTATMEEDYDLSSIEIKEENRSGKIVLEGRKSTIYGCYVEKELEEEPEQPEEKPADIPVLNYEDDKVTVSVTAEEAGIIPEGAELKVLPITSEDTETKEQYQEVEKKIQEKVAEEEKEVAGFLAYDITFVDKDGNEMEPNGKVKVSMNYKKAELPPEVVEKKATDAEVTVLHLEEDENGEVKQVVDMAAEQKATVDTLATTEGTKVQNVEVETESFSVFTITWKYYPKLNIQIVDESGKGIGEDTSLSIDGESEVSIIAPQVLGYQFLKACIGDVSGTQFSKLKCEKELLGNSWKYYSNSSWKDIGQNKVYFVYRQEQLKDLHGKAITPDKYSKLKAEAAEETIPIQWTRFKNHADISKDTKWTWDELMRAGLGNSTEQWTEDYKVWDGSRASDDGKSSDHNYDKYLEDNTITVYNDKMYDSATWTKTGNPDSYYRFRGSFDLKDIHLEEGYSYADYNYTIQSVLNSIDQHIYINDNMYVFVYPKDVTLSNENYMDYLSFWTGTSNQNGSVYFHERRGTRAYRPL